MKRSGASVANVLGGDAVAQATAGRRAITAFRVGDNDAGHAWLASDIGPVVVQPPTTMPWGNRSMLLRDPDGTLVNLFAPMTAGAEQRLDRP